MLPVPFPDVPELLLPEPVDPDELPIPELVPLPLPEEPVPLLPLEPPLPPEPPLWKWAM